MKLRYNRSGHWLPELPPQHRGIHAMDMQVKNRQARSPQIRAGSMQQYKKQARIPPTPPSLVRPNFMRGPSRLEFRDHVSVPQMPVRPAAPMRPRMRDLSPSLTGVEIKQSRQTPKFKPAPPIRPNIRDQTPEMKRLARFGMTAITDDPFRPETMPGRSGPNLKNVNKHGGWFKNQIARIKRKMRRGYEDELKAPLTAEDAQRYMSDDFIRQKVAEQRRDPGPTFNDPNGRRIRQRVRHVLPPIEINKLRSQMRGTSSLASRMNAFGRQAGRAFDTQGFRG